jgi:hypothetical protein
LGRIEPPRMLPGTITAGSFDLTPPGGSRQGFWGRFRATRVTIDDSGIRFDYGPSKSRKLSWNDPNLRFTLMDFREPVKTASAWTLPPGARGMPFQFRFGHPYSGATPISEAAFSALTAAARSAGLVMVEGGNLRGVPSGSLVFVYGRKRP